MLAQVLGAEETPPPPPAKKTQEHEDVLKFLTVPPADLPKQVRMVEELRTSPLIPVKSNPDVLVDPPLMMPVASFFGIRDTSDLESVRFVAAALYQEKLPANEIGVFGLYFTDEAVAKKRFEKLAKDAKSSPYILRGRLLLFVWKDPAVSDSAFEAVRDYFSAAKFDQTKKVPPKKETAR